MDFRRFVLACSMAALAAPAWAQQDAANLGVRLLADPAIKAAVDAIRAAEPQTIED